MKDQLVDKPVTIGDLRSQGAQGILVRCVLPCRHVAAVGFDALKLPDDTPYTGIPTLKRLRCGNCERLATTLEIAVDRGLMSGWGVVPGGSASS